MINGWQWTPSPLESSIRSLLREQREREIPFLQEQRRERAVYAIGAGLLILDTSASRFFKQISLALICCNLVMDVMITPDVPLTQKNHAYL